VACRGEFASTRQTALLRSCHAHIVPSDRRLDFALQSGMDCGSGVAEPAFKAGGERGSLEEPTDTKASTVFCPLTLSFYWEFPYTNLAISILLKM
jgi:hypothetical protein